MEGRNAIRVATWNLQHLTPEKVISYFSLLLLQVMLFSCFTVLPILSHWYQLSDDHPSLAIAPVLLDQCQSSLI